MALSSYERNLQKAIVLLKELYEGRITEISTEEELLRSEPVFVVEDLQVLIEFKKTSHVVETDQVHLSKLEIIDGKESRVTMTFALNELEVQAERDFHLLNVALEFNSHRSKE